MKFATLAVLSFATAYVAALALGLAGVPAWTVATIFGVLILDLVK